MKIKAVWAVRVVPEDEDETLHEFALAWYRLTEDPDDVDPNLKIPAQPAVWVKFSKFEQLESMQAHFPEAKLGPVSSYTEAILFAESPEAARALQKKVYGALRDEEEEDEIDRLLKEDTMEDY